MNNDYDENNRYILEDKSFVDTKTNECLNFGIKDLSRVTVQLNCLERYLNDAEQQIAELQKQLEEKEKDNQFFKKMYLSEKQKNDNYHTEKYELDKPIEELRKIKLNPKEKEIYYKGFDNCERQFATHIIELQQQSDKLYSENKQLRQQLKSQPAEIVGKIKAYYETSIYDRSEAHTKVKVLFSRLDTILKEYQKEKI